MTGAPSHFYLIDWCVLIAYFAGTMGIGLYFYRQTRSTEGYTAANRSLPGWVCGLSIFATFLSSISYLALPGKSFAANWNPFVFSLSLPLVTWIAVRWFLPYYRATNEISAYALLEHRFGLWARIYASVFYLLTQVARIGVVLYLMALPMQVIFGWNIYTILIVTGICVTLYSFVGGILAVIWTDAIQAIVLMVGAVICLTVMLWNMPGGMEHMLEVASEHDKFSLGSFGLETHKETFWIILAYGVVINLQNFGIDQSYVQRYVASSSEEEAKRGLWLGGLLYVPVSAMFFFIGTALFAFYEADQSAELQDPTAIVAPSRPGEIDLDQVRWLVARQRLLQEGMASDDPQLAERATALAPEVPLAKVGDRVFPHFIARHLPPGVTGLLVAAVFAAAMSTVSTSLNSSATLVMSDYYRRMFRPDASQRELMLTLYSATIAWGAMGTGLALVLVRLTENALDIWWALAGIFGGGMTGLFLLGMISRAAKNRAAITGVILGVVVILWLSLPKLTEIGLALPEGTPPYQLALTIKANLGSRMSPLHTSLIPVIGTLVILLTGMAVTAITGRGGPSETVDVTQAKDNP